MSHKMLIGLKDRVARPSCPPERAEPHPPCSDDTIEPFVLPAVGRNKLAAAFDGGRIPSNGGVMLLAAAERRIGIAATLAALIDDPRGPAGADAAQRQ